MPGPKGALTVRVSDGQTDRHVTQYARNLGFSKVAPGGYRGMNCQLVLPRDTFRDLGPQDRLYYYDTRTGRTIIDGYIENPTPVDGPNGQLFDISAVGGMALANDETRALMYIDRDLGRFEKDILAGPSSTFEIGESITFPGFQRIRVMHTPGQPVPTGGFAASANYTMERAGMSLGAVRAVPVSGKNDVNYRVRFQTPTGSVDPGPGTMSAGAFDFTVWAGTDFPSGTTQRFAFYLVRVGPATNIASGDDSTWTDFVDVVVLGQRMDRNGTLLTGAAGMVSSLQVTASQIVEDLLGRLLTMCDPGTAEIATTTWPIDQLAYPDGVKAAQVLSDLEAWEFDHLWEMLETLPNGLHRFAYRPWPTTARYEVSVKDGWRQTGSDTDLCNRILVSWTDVAGKIQTLPVTAAGLGLTGIGLPVDALGTRIKDADPITLPDGLGSEANALRIGGQILTDKINPPKAGTVVVRRPIVDMLTGNQVMPWELEPGYLVRVRETGDQLRMTEMSYDDDSVSATLTLGQPVLTTEQRVARLAAA